MENENQQSRGDVLDDEEIPGSDNEPIVILTDEALDEFGLDEKLSPISQLSPNALNRQLYFDFDDTLINTSALKELVVFPAAKAMIPRLSLDDAKLIYETIREKFSLGVWSKALKKFAADNPSKSYQISPDFPEMNNNFREKFRESSRKIIPQDTINLVKILNRIGAPLNIVTKGNAQFQVDKIRLLAEVLSEDVLGVRPFTINVHVVDPEVAERDPTQLNPQIDPLPFANVQIHGEVTSAEDKGKALLDIAKKNDVYQIFYINDKAEENKQIQQTAIRNRQQSHDDQESEIWVGTYGIQRDGQKGSVILQDLQKVAESVDNYQDEHFLGSLSERLVESKFQQPATHDETSLPAIGRLSDVPRLLRELLLNLTQSLKGAGKFSISEDIVDGKVEEWGRNIEDLVRKDLEQKDLVRTPDSETDLKITLDKLFDKQLTSIEKSNNSSPQKTSLAFKISLAIDYALHFLDGEKASYAPDEFAYYRDAVKKCQKPVLDFIRQRLDPSIDVKAYPVETELFSGKNLKAIQQTLNKDPKDIDLSEWERAYRFLAHPLDGLVSNVRRIYENHGKGMVYSDRMIPREALNLELKQMVDVWNAALDQSIEHHKNELEQEILNRLHLSYAEVQIVDPIRPDRLMVA